MYYEAIENIFWFQYLFSYMTGVPRTVDSEKGGEWIKGPRFYSAKRRYFDKIKCKYNMAYITMLGK